MVSHLLFLENGPYASGSDVCGPAELYTSLYGVYWECTLSPGRRVKTPHVGFHPPAPNWSFREERKPGQSHSKGFLRASGAAPGKLPDLHRQWRRPGTPGCADDGPAGC